MPKRDDLSSAIAEQADAVRKAVDDVSEATDAAAIGTRAMALIELQRIVASLTRLRKKLAPK